MSDGFTFGDTAVAPEDTAPRVFVNLPGGQYIGEFLRPVWLEGKSGYRALGLVVRTLRTLDGNTTIQVGDQDVNVAGRTFDSWDTYRLTTLLVDANGNERTDEKAQESYRISREQAVTVAAALGVAETNGDGNFVMPSWVSTWVDVEQLYSGATGAEVILRIANAVQERDGVQQKNDDGSPRRRNEVKGVHPLNS